MIVGALFTHEQELTQALEALEEHGFREYTVFGPEELFKEPIVRDDVEDSLESSQHTSAGTISGITADPGPANEEDPDARPLEDEFQDFGIGPEETDFYVAGIQQNHAAVLVSAHRGRAEEIRRILQAQGAILPSS